MYIDIGAVPELVQVNNSPFIVGGAVTLATLIAALESNSSNAAYFYGQRMANHIKKVMQPLCFSLCVSEEETL